MRRARAAARNRRITLRALMLDGLELALEGEGASRAPYVLSDESFGEGGLNEGVDMMDWERIRELSYEGRGR